MHQSPGSTRFAKIYERSIVFVLLAAALVLGSLAYFKVPARIKKPELIATDISAHDLEGADSLVLGDSTSPRKVIMFGDYECPPCRAEWSKIENLFREKRSDLAIYFRNFPLTTIHPNALSAAIASTRAKRCGVFPQIHRILYTSSLEPVDLNADLKKLHVPIRAADDFECRKQVAADFDLGLRMGVNSTPTMFYVDRRGAVYSLPTFDALPAD